METKKKLKKPKRPKPMAPKAGVKKNSARYDKGGILKKKQS